MYRQMYRQERSVVNGFSRALTDTKKPVSFATHGLYGLCRTSTDFDLVPMAGLEPARLTPLPPQDSVSTNSTTSAYLGLFRCCFYFNFFNNGFCSFSSRLNIFYYNGRCIIRDDGYTFCCWSIIASIN